MILEILHKSQAHTVSSESRDMSALPAASESIMTFLLGPQRKWKREVEAEPRHGGRQEEGIMGEKEKREQSR